MLRIISTHAQGFGSLGEISYKWDRPGMNQIIGENGSGKTTIGSAMVWCFYGQGMKKGSSVLTWPQFRNKNFTGTKVVNLVKIDNSSYLISRYKDWAGKKDGIVIEKDGVVQDQFRDKKDAQKEINRLLGFSYNLFKSCIIFGQGMKRLIEEDGPSKKEILEEAFEVTYISLAKDIAEKQLKDLRVVLAHTQSTIVLLEAKIESYQDRKEDEELMIKRFEKDRQSDIRAVKEKMEALKAELKTKKVDGGKLAELTIKINTLKARMKKVDDDFFKINLTIESNEARVEQKENEIKSIKAGMLAIICPACNQPLKGKARENFKVGAMDKLKSLKSQVSKFQKEIEELKGQLPQIKGQVTSKETIKNYINSKQETIKKLEISKKEIENQQAELKLIQGTIDTYKIHLAELKGKKLTLSGHNWDELIQQSQDQLAVDQKTFRILTTKANNYTWAIADPLSNSGLKAYIFNTMLTLINKRAAYYEKFLGFRPEFVVDLESGRKDITIVIYSKGNIYPYEDFSGGQRQLINVCIAFSTHDVIAKNKQCNLLIMDEIFEGMSDNNREKTYELLLEKSQNKSLHLITHHKLFSTAKSYVTNLELQGGLTRIVQ